MRARPRYIIIGNMSFNGHDLRGQVMVDLGECTGSGVQKREDGKRILKRDLTHRLLRFEDKKWLKTHGIPTATLTIEKSRMDWSVAPHAPED